MPAAYQGLGYHELNAMLNLYGPNGEIQFEADREAAHQYFLQHVNNNTVFFHDLEEKLDYLVKNEYYERETLDQYTMNFIRELYNRAYKKKFRFETFLGAFKFYTSYTLKTFDGKRFLERYEDRVCMVALHLARGDEKLATADGGRDHRGPLPAGHPHVPERRQDASAASWSPASCSASKTTWSRSAGPSTPPCSCPSAAAAWRSR